MNNLPNKAGVWEWFPEKGNRRLVLVCDIFNNGKYFRVYWAGGYYDVAPDPADDTLAKITGRTAQERFDEAGWSHGTWGKYMGNQEDFKDEALYLTFEG